MAFKYILLVVFGTIFLNKIDADINPFDFSTELYSCPQCFAVQRGGHLNGDAQFHCSQIYLMRNCVKNLSEKAKEKDKQIEEMQANIRLLSERIKYLESQIAH